MAETSPVEVFMRQGSNSHILSMPRLEWARNRAHPGNNKVLRSDVEAPSPTPFEIASGETNRRLF
jgi:hypothetical protein